MGNVEKVKTKKPFYKSLMMLAMATIVVGSLTGCSDEGGSSEATEEKTEAAEVKEFAVGEEVKVGNLAYIVNSVEETNEITGLFDDKTTTEGKFIIVDLTIKNNDKEAKTVDSSMFKVVTADGTEYENDSSLDMYVNEDIGFFLEEINPNLSKTGKVVFELSADTAEYDLQVSDGFWADEFALIKLK